MRGAELLQTFGHDAQGKVRFVAFAAQVGEVEMFQVGAHDLRDGFGGGFVREMAVSAEDALLETPRTARTILQHLHVVIGFEDEDVRGADAVEHHPGHVAEVGDEADVAAGRAQKKSNRVLRVVGNLKRFDEQIVQFKIVAGRKEPPFEFGQKIGTGFFQTVEKRIAFFAVPSFLERPRDGVLRGAIAINGNF